MWICAGKTSITQLFTATGRENQLTIQLYDLLYFCYRKSPNILKLTNLSYRHTQNPISFVFAYSPPYRLPGCIRYQSPFQLHINSGTTFDFEISHNRIRIYCWTLLIDSRMWQPGSSHQSQIKRHLSFNLHPQRTPIFECVGRNQITDVSIPSDILCIFFHLVADND